MIIFCTKFFLAAHCTKSVRWWLRCATLRAARVTPQFVPRYYFYATNLRVLFHRVFGVVRKINYYFFFLANLFVLSILKDKTFSKARVKPSFGIACTSFRKIRRDNTSASQSKLADILNLKAKTLVPFQEACPQRPSTSSTASLS